MPQFSVVSFLWMLFSLALGTGYAVLLYRNNNLFSSGIRKLLFLFRALTVAVICFLLMAPFIRTTRKTVEKPIIILAQDNTASLSISRPRGFDKQAYLRSFESLERRLSAKYDVRTFSVGSDVREGLRSSFDEKTTNISRFFHYLSDQFGGSNLGAVVLATDGLYNAGGNPEPLAKNLKCPVFAVALGDTTRKRDLLVSNVHYNSVVYSGNDFRVEVDIEAFLSKGMNSVLSIRTKDGVVWQQPVNINSNEFHTTVPVTLHAGPKGMHRYHVELRPLAAEVAVENNQAEFFVEALDGKRKVFILAAAPHPDITALKQGIEANGNYQVLTGLAGQFSEKDLKESDLVILHQVPSPLVPFRNFGKYLSGKPILFVLGAQSDIAAFNRAQDLLEIQQSGGYSEVTGQQNSDFYAFTPEPGLEKSLPALGQLLVPTGSYRLKSDASVLLYQRQGRSATDKPLAVFSTGRNKKAGVLAGEGIWRWRLADFAGGNAQGAVDQMLNRIVQFLSDQADRRKFNVYPARAAFDENERILFNAELYNDANELINEPEVQIEIRDSKGKIYPFVFSRTGRSYILDAGNLPFGEYSFESRTRLGSKQLKAGGKFLVTRAQAEYRQVVANHQLLKAIAKQSGGTVVSPFRLADLDELIKKNELVKSVSYENRTFTKMIDMKWLFVLIVCLLSAEWFLRKRSGDL